MSRTLSLPCWVNPDEVPIPLSKSWVTTKVRNDGFFESAKVHQPSTTDEKHVELHFCFKKITPCEPPIVSPLTVLCFHATKGDFPLSHVEFMSKSRPSHEWDNWIKHIFYHDGYRALLDKVGIYDSIHDFLL